MAERVVFDCNIYFQALISPNGPAGACLTAAQQGRLQLFVTEHVIQELTEFARVHTWQTVLGSLPSGQDKDLLALNDHSTAVGQAFHEQFPELEIIEPVELLARIGNKKK